MRRLSLLSLALAALAGCLSPSQYCEAVNRTSCRRLFECATGPERDALLTVYADEAACGSALTERTQCATQTERSFCVGKKWNPAKADACIKEIEQASCEALSSYRPTCAAPCE